MAFRAVNSCSVFRSASSPPLSAFRCCHFNPRNLQFRWSSKLNCRSPVLWHKHRVSRSGGGRFYYLYSIVESVVEELEALSRRKKVFATAKMGMVGMSSDDGTEDKLMNRTLEKGRLLEFKKDSERVLLAVAQRPDGKKNWMVFDQNGVTSSIKPQQVTYIVPGVENFEQTEIADFIKKAEDNLDPSLLEFAWLELLEQNKAVTTEELAEVMKFPGYPRVYGNRSITDYSSFYR